MTSCWLAPLLIRARTSLASNHWATGYQMDGSKNKIGEKIRQTKNGPKNRWIAAKIKLGEKIRQTKNGPKNRWMAAKIK